MPKRSLFSVDETKEQLFRFLDFQIEWLLRDEQLSTFFNRTNLDRKFLQTVIEHVQSSLDINKTNCICEQIPLTFVLGIEKSIELFHAVKSNRNSSTKTFRFFRFQQELTKIRIRDKFILAKCAEYFVLVEPMNEDFHVKQNRRISGNFFVRLNFEANEMKANHSSFL